MVIKYLVLLSFFGVIKTRFSHYENFDNFPDQVYFMMILDACNTSSAILVEVTQKDLTNISFNDLAGGNIPDLDNTSLRTN